MTMNYDIEPSEFVQVIHNGRGHWLTISSISTSHPDVHVYGSMYPSAGTLVKAQIAALLHTENLPAIHECSHAGRRYDCGLFICCDICYCTGIWRAPRSISLRSRQNASPSVELFRGKADISVSVQLRRATESIVKSVDEVPVYCVCRMPELPKTRWIKCSGCKRCYHTESCINAPCTDVYKEVLCNV